MNSFRVAALLSFCGGFLDAYSYIARGHVFAFAQTGNIVLFGVNLSEGEPVKALLYAPPLLAFALGIFATDIIRAKFQHLRVLTWQKIILVIEVAAMALVALIPAAHNHLATIIIAFLCAAQFASFKLFEGCPYSPFMSTGNLRSGMEAWLEYRRTKDEKTRQKAGKYYKIILLFIGGAIFGGAVVPWLGLRAILVNCLLLSAAFAVMEEE